MSSDKQDTRRQLESVAELVERTYPGAPPELFHEDAGISASRVSLFVRPETKRLCQLIKAGRVRAVVADELSRICRGRESEWALFYELCEDHDVEIRTVHQGLISGQMGSLYGQMLAGHARAETIDKEHRVRSGKTSLAKAGYFPGGRLPYGCRKVPVAVNGRDRFVLAADEQRIDQLVAGLHAFARGAGHATVARILGVAPTNVRKILGSPAYVGRIVWNGEEYDGLHEPLVPVELWRQVRRRLETDRAAFVKPQPANPLGNLLRCRCGRSPRLFRTGERRYLYCKRRCGQPGYRLEQVEAAVLLGLGGIQQTLRLHLHDPDWHVTVSDSARVARLDTALTALREQRRRLLRHVTNDGDSVLDEMLAENRRDERAVLEELERERDDAAGYRAELARLRGQLATLHEFRDVDWGSDDENDEGAAVSFWARSTTGERAAFLTRLVDELRLADAPEELRALGVDQVLELHFAAGIVTPAPIVATRDPDGLTALRALGCGGSESPHLVSWQTERSPCRR